MLDKASMKVLVWNGVEVFGEGRVGVIRAGK